MTARLVIMVAPIRTPLTQAAMLVILLGLVPGLTAQLPVLRSLQLAATVVFVALVSMILPVAAVKREPVTLRPPVRGRWVAVNSPASRVPGHGLHVCGQTYAIGLIDRPGTSKLTSSPACRPPSELRGHARLSRLARQKTIRRYNAINPAGPCAAPLAALS